MAIRRRRGQWHYRFSFRGREYSGCTGYADCEENAMAAAVVEMARREELRQVKPRAVVKRVVSVSLNFGEAAEAFLDWCENVEYREKASTAARLRGSFAALRDFFGGQAVASVDGPQIEGFKAWRFGEHMVQAVTVRHDLHALSVFYRKWAIPRGLAKANPVRTVTVPSDAESIQEHVVTAAEEAAYFAAAAGLHAAHCKQVKGAPPNLADLARLMLETGARPDELVSARSANWDAAAGTLRIAGGKSRAARRVLYVTAPAREILVRRAAWGGAWLFPSERRPGHHLGQLNTTHDRVCREAGVSFRLYDWRHTFATRAIEAGVPAAVVAAILGHGSLRTIGRYVHPTEDAQREAMVRYQTAANVRRAG